MIIAAIGAIAGSASGPSYPPAGTYYDTQYGVEYPIAEGGGAVSYNASSYPNQLADVIVKNDGSGGTYIDWSTASNVVFKPYGTVFASETGSVVVTVPNPTTNYTISDSYVDVAHDGNGFYAYVNASNNYYYASGQLFHHYPQPGSNTVYVAELDADFPSASWSGTNYIFDGGSGYYEQQTDVTYTSNGTLFGTYGDANNNYAFGGGTVSYYDAYGNFLTPYYQFYLHGAFADGMGGYYVGNSGQLADVPDQYLFGSAYPNNYSGPTGDVNNGYGYEYRFNAESISVDTLNVGGYFPYGTELGSISQQTEVPSGSAQWFENGMQDDYFWDGNGGSYGSSSGSYHALSTFIYNDGTYDYYWDGNGGYYT